GMQIDRFKTHDIEIVVDRLKVDEERRSRISQSLNTAFRLGNDLVFIFAPETDEIRPFSKSLMDAESGISYEEPSPNSFSFNSPYGSCPVCKGLGEKNEVDIQRVIPDDSKSINDEAIQPFGPVRENLTFKQLRAISKKYGFTFATPVNQIPKKALD